MVGSGDVAMVWMRSKTYLASHNQACALNTRFGDLATRAFAQRFEHLQVPFEDHRLRTRVTRLRRRGAHFRCVCMAKVVVRVPRCTLVRRRIARTQVAGFQRAQREAVRTAVALTSVIRNMHSLHNALKFVHIVSRILIQRLL